MFDCHTMSAFVGLSVSFIVSLLGDGAACKPMQPSSHLQRRHPLSLLSEGRDGGGRKVNKHINASSPHVISC